MRGLQFPVENTKVNGVNQKFDLTNVEERKKYFQAKVGQEIETIRKFLDKNTFVAYLLGKKNAGKGTYTKLFMEVFGSDKIVHVSVGDVVRAVSVAMQDPKAKQELEDYMEKNYRGFLSLDEAMDAFMGRNASALLPTEFILTLVKREIDKYTGKSIFLDGFSRSLDQLPYALYFKELINHKNDPDFFVLIDLPTSVIDERIKYRVVCPKCNAPRNLKLLATQKVLYDKANNKFQLVCDNPSCGGAIMVEKEGDSLGIEPIRARLEADEVLIKKVFTVQGVPNVLLRNSIPAKDAIITVDDYEITPEFTYQYDQTSGEVKVGGKFWEIKDDEGIPSYSLMPAAVMIGMIRQIARILA
ncbi:MAG: hypothetical protein V1707_01635 [bacterium]